MLVYIISFLNIISRTSDRLSTSDFQLQILGVRLWTSVLDLDNIQLTDFRLWFQTRILDILWTSDFRHNSDSFRASNFRFRQTSYIRLPIVDFRHQFSDFVLWTSDILQTSDYSLHCQISYRRQTSDSKTRLIYLSHNKNRHTYVTK